MQKYLSKTEKIQVYIKEVLDDEQKHNMKDIISHVDSKLKESGEFVFQINSYVNAAMRLLMKNEDYAKVSHGVYQKGGIPYTPASKKADLESDFEKMDIRSAMVAVKAYANSFEKLYAQKIKLKAIMQRECPTSSKQALSLVNDIALYELEYYIDDEDKYGTEYMRRILPSNFDIDTFEGKGFYYVGEILMKKLNIFKTDYGIISQKGHSLYEGIYKEQSHEENEEIEMGGMQM